MDPQVEKILIRLKKLMLGGYKHTRSFFFFFVDLRSRTQKEAKIRHNTITFINEKARRIHQPHDDSLVVSIILVNKKVYIVLIENKSSVDILCIYKMKIG